MATRKEYIPYEATGAFSALVLDYIRGNEALRPFYEYVPNDQGIAKAMAHRKTVPAHRNELADILTEQYASMPNRDLAMRQIEKLRKDNCFTVCTAHQPNLFTGHLYFVYKILHAIRLAEHIQSNHPEIDCVPVFYMGSEDADLEELGVASILGTEYRWNTSQTGAVGRMKVDKPLLELLKQLEGRLAVEPFGTLVTDLLKDCYQPGRLIEDACFELVHRLFGKYGLLVLIPDRPKVKALFRSVMQDELLQSRSHQIVQETLSRFPSDYKVQAMGREINLFYLDEQGRNRIEISGDGFKVAGHPQPFSKEDMVSLLQTNPERFSPNVILRPLLQETVLPNLAFIGGGGELAYWMELADVFRFYEVPLPCIILRNSFLMLEPMIEKLRASHHVSHKALFQKAQSLIDEKVKDLASDTLNLEAEKSALRELYQMLAQKAGLTDPTLKEHTEALYHTAEKKWLALEKKMLRSEKKKAEAMVRQIQKISMAVFPEGTLQERHDNIMSFLSRYGAGLMDDLLDASLALEPLFCIVWPGEQEQA